MREPIRETQFVEEWIDMTPKIPVPKIDWIREKKLDMAYGDDPLQRLDIYYPNDTKRQRYPVLILVHGGGFTHCDKRDWHLYPGFHALGEGFALASVNYRLAPRCPFPAAPDDVKAATAWLRRNAGELQLDEQNFFLYGTSAGGNLVAYAGLDGSASRGTVCDYHVNAVASLCPGINFKDWIEQTPWYLRLLPSMCRTLRGYLGGDPRRFPELAARASADERIAPNPPAFYIQHGEKDPLVSVKQSVDFYEKLKASGYFKEGDLVLDILKDTPHAGAGPQFLEPLNVMPILRFFQKHMEPLKKESAVSAEREITYRKDGRREEF